MRGPYFQKGFYNRFCLWGQRNTVAFGALACLMRWRSLFLRDLACLLKVEVTMVALVVLNIIFRKLPLLLTLIIHLRFTNKNN